MLNIQLTEEQAQRAIKFLAKSSYEDVADIIEEFKYQGSQQLAEQENIVRVAVEWFNEKNKEEANKK